VKHLLSKRKNCKKMAGSPKSPRILVRRNIIFCRGEKAEGCHGLFKKRPDLYSKSRILVRNCNKKILYDIHVLPMI